MNFVALDLSLFPLDFIFLGIVIAILFLLCCGLIYAFLFLEKKVLEKKQVPSLSFFTAHKKAVLIAWFVVTLLIYLLLVGPIFYGRHDPYGNANTIIQDSVKKISQQGYGLQVRDNVVFNAGDDFFKKDAIGESPIAQKDVHYYCSTGTESSATCTRGTDAPITINSDTEVIVNKKVQGTVAACLGDDQQYWIVIGAITSEVTSDANRLCRLQ